METASAFDQGLVAFKSGPPPSLAATGNPANAREAAEEFAAFFLSQFVSSMSAGIETGGYFGGGPGEDVFRTLMHREYGQILARSGRIGLTDAVYREILKSQEMGES